MRKSVYSLVLSDDVIAEIDRAAYRSGVSRSALVNEILADFVSYVTPEKRMQQIFSQAEELLTGGGVFQSLLQASDSMMSLRSALDYKYHPSVRYSVELDPAVAGSGELRVSLRSQNSQLLLYFRQFFLCWARTEQQYLGQVDCSVEAGRYVRRLQLPQNLDPSEAGTVIAGYIDALDSGMQSFFASLDEPQTAMQAVTRSYQKYLKEFPAI